MAHQLNISARNHSDLPQFTLRTLFLAITCLCILFGVLGTIGLPASCGLLLILALVGLHIVGNALGVKLREQTGSPADDDSNPVNTRCAPYDSLTINCPQSVSGLFRREGLGRIIYIAAAGAVAGGLLGALFLMNFADTSVRGVIVGAVSSAILGAFFGFLEGCFLKTWLSAWWQASSESDKFDHRWTTKLSAPPSASINASTPSIADLDARLTTLAG